MSEPSRSCPVAGASANAWRASAGLALLACLAVYGGFQFGIRFRQAVQRDRRLPPAAPRLPLSKLPGPPRPAALPPFTLDEHNSRVMLRRDDSENERGADLLGNYYLAAEVARSRLAAGGGPQAPCVRVAVQPCAETFRGRLEAQRLKPNFAYQIKLLGDYARDPAGFERIGLIGRWRLPGRATNYTDADFRAYSGKTDVEAYVFFDYFVTDARGNAVRDFALDSSLHVLWKASQRWPGVSADVTPWVIDASDPAVYLFPKMAPAPPVVGIWAERESARYRRPDQVIRLPAGDYAARLALTEESWHASDCDSGWWATTFVLPVTFTVTAAPPERAP